MESLYDKITRCKNKNCFGKYIEFDRIMRNCCICSVEEDCKTETEMQERRNMSKL